MKLDAADIQDLVQETERKRSDWAAVAEKWEDMWALKRFGDNRKDIKELDGIEAITTPDPFNIVQLVTRFVASDIRIEIPYISATEEDDDRSTKIEEWATSFWQRSSRQQGRNLIDDMTWLSAVRGRGAMQILWIKEELPKKLQSKRLPILPRTLDPFNVGVKRGPYWTEHAYHKYEASRSDIQQRYPKYEMTETKGTWRQHWSEKLKVIDFWYMDEAGNVCHTVTVDGKFAKEPKITDYPEIPIIEWMADGAPIEDELARSLSILHPIRTSWQYKCELASKIGTGLLYYFDPLLIAMGFDPGQKVQVGPGEIAYLEQGQSLDALRPEPNVPMAEKMLALIQTGIDQATFPAVTFGEAPGGVQAGFALNNLAQQARSRVNTIRGNLEGALEAGNELILGLVEVFGEKDGVEMWGKSSMGDRSRPVNLSAKDIKGNYANEVRLIPEIPSDETGRIGIWLQMVKEGIVSKGTMRNRGVNIPLPRDEETRISVERALDMPEMAQKHTLRAMQKAYKQDDWELMISGTPLQQVHEAEMAWKEQKEAEAEAAREAKRQEKMQREMEAAQMSAMQAQGMGGPMIPPPGMGMHRMPDGTMMPDSMMGPGNGPMPMAQRPPEAMGDPSMMQPPMQGGPPMPPDMGMQPPGLPGIPPEAAGQMTPEMMGIPPGGPPGQFQALMGEPLSDEEMLQRLTGGQPPAI